MSGEKFAEEAGLMGRGECAARENIGSRYFAATMTQRMLVQAVAILARRQLRAYLLFPFGGPAPREAFLFISLDKKKSR